MDQENTSNLWNLNNENSWVHDLQPTNLATYHNTNTYNKWESEEEIPSHEITKYFNKCPKDDEFEL